MKFNMLFGNGKSEDNDTKYEPLNEAFLPTNTSSHDTLSQAKLKSNYPPPLSQRLGWIFLNTIVIIFAVVGFVNLTVRARTTLWPTKLPSCNCGTTGEESLAMGCKFDTLSHSWLQPYCIDDELTAEFDRQGPGPNGEWQFWLDPNGTQPITTEEMSMLPYNVKVWSVYAWHINHCLYYWRKMYRSRFRDHIVEGKYDNEFHIMHCTRETMNRADLMAIKTTAYTYFDADHSSHEASFPPSVKEMFSIDHELAEDAKDAHPNY